MVTNTYNHQLAEETPRILLANVPRLFKPFVKKLITALMGERLCRAMLYDTPAPIYHHVIDIIFGARNFFLQILCLPVVGGVGVLLEGDRVDRG
jgi:hypothetical protein